MKGKLNPQSDTWASVGYLTSDSSPCQARIFWCYFFKFPCFNGLGLFVLQPFKEVGEPFPAEVGAAPAGTAGLGLLPSLTRQGAPHKSGISVITEDESDSVMPIKRVYLSRDHLVITQIPFQFLFPFPHYLGVMSVVLASGLGLFCSLGSFSFLPQFMRDSSRADLCGVLRTLWRQRGIFVTFRKYLQDVRRVSGISKYLIKDISR